MYCYIQSERQVFTVGIYRPDKIHGGEKWEPESDWSTREQAGARVNYLNGGTGLPYTTILEAAQALQSIKQLADSIYEYGIMVQNR